MPINLNLINKVSNNIYTLALDHSLNSPWTHYQAEMTKRQLQFTLAYSYQPDQRSSRNFYFYWLSAWTTWMLEENMCWNDAELKRLGYIVNNSVSTSPTKEKPKSAYKPSGPIKVIAYPTFCSMKWLGYFYSSLDGMLVHHRVTSSTIYTPGWREALQQ